MAASLKPQYIQTYPDHCRLDSLELWSGSHEALAFLMCCACSVSMQSTLPWQLQYQSDEEFDVGEEKDKHAGGFEQQHEELDPFCRSLWLLMRINHLSLLPLFQGLIICGMVCCSRHVDPNIPFASSLHLKVRRTKRRQDPRSEKITKVQDCSWSVGSRRPAPTHLDTFAS